MPRAVIQTANANLDQLSTGNKKKVHVDVIDKIKRVSDLMREKNNIIIGTNYRLDAKPMSAAGNGFNAGDYKLDIQTVTKQKAQSTTVAVVYVSPLAPETSLQDLIDSFTDCMDTQDIYRVT
jgi:hypothetical protein